MPIFDPQLLPEFLDFERFGNIDCHVNPVLKKASIGTYPASPGFPEGQFSGKAQVRTFVVGKSTPKVRIGFHKNWFAHKILARPC